jgi:hypothetical protein
MAVGNINAQGFIPEIWDAAVYRTLEDNLVAKKICRNYSSKVKQAGDTIHFNGLADPTISSYTGTATTETLVSGRVSLLVDQQNYYAYTVTDIEDAMANVDLKGSQAERAGYGLRKACDTYIHQLYSQSAHSAAVTDTTCDTTTILSDIAEMKLLLAENNVDENDMWVTLAPWMQTKLELAGVKFQINNGINGKGGMSWTKVLGMDAYVTNQVYATGGVTYPMAGSYNAIVFAEGLMKSESLRSTTNFTTILRGLHVFGCKVIKPKELVYAALTETAETAI